MVSAAERAYQSIRDTILSGGYEAGSRLREEELSRQLSVSRTPIREALRKLTAEGLVEFLPHRGAHVASWSDAVLQEIFELRALIESHAVGRAAGRMGDEDIEQLVKLADEMDQAAAEGRDDVSERVAELNNEFHQVLVRKAGSERLASFVGQLVQIPLVHRTFRRYSPRELQRSFHQHRDLIDACRVRDSAWAESVMRSHVLAARHIFNSDDEPAADTEELGHA